MGSALLFGLVVLVSVPLPFRSVDEFPSSLNADHLRQACTSLVDVLQEALELTLPHVIWQRGFVMFCSYSASCSLLERLEPDTAFWYAMQGFMPQLGNNLGTNAAKYHVKPS